VTDSSIAATKGGDHHHRTGHRGITYRVTNEGRQYYCYEHSLRRQNRSPYVPAGRSLQSALLKQAELRQRKGRGEKTIVASKASFSEVAELWYSQKADRLAASSSGAYRFALDRIHLPRFNSWKIAAVDADAYAKLVRDLEREGLHAIDPTQPKRPLSPATIQRYMVPLRQVVAFAARRGLIGHDPLKNLTRDDRPRQADSEPPHEWTDQEITALITAAEQLAAQPEARASYVPLLTVAVFTGLRQSELLGLQWSDIDFEQRVLTVERQWLRCREFGPPKSAAGRRRVPLADNVIAVLRQQKAEAFAAGRAKSDDLVFCSRRGTALSHRNVVRAFERVRDHAGLDATLSFHSTRHAFASLCAHRGIDIGTLSTFMGHRDVSVTLRVYTHLFNRQRVEDTFRALMSADAKA